MSDLATSERTAALAFAIPGKSAKQLEDWLKKYRYEDYLTVKGNKDRYAFVQLVEKAQKEMQAEQSGGESSTIEDVVTPSQKGKRKSRVSLGYADGKPSPPSERVKKSSKATGKRKSRGSQQTEVDEEEKMDLESQPASESGESESEISTASRPSKKQRTTKSTGGAAMKKATAKSKAGAKKGRGRKSASATSHAEDEDSGSVGSMDEESHMSDESELPGTSIPVTHLPLEKKPESAPVTSGFIDSSLFGTKPSSVVIEDEDVEMQPVSSPSPAPPVPLVPNPFQKSPTVAKTTSEPSPITTAVAFPQPPSQRWSLGGPSAIISPFTPSPAVATTTSARPIISPNVPKFQPLHPTPPAFAPISTARPGFIQTDVSVEDEPLATEEELNDAFGSQFTIPDHIPLQRQASPPAVSMASAVEALRTGRSPRHEPMKATESPTIWSLDEEKYPTPTKSPSAPSTSTVTWRTPAMAKEEKYPAEQDEQQQRENGLRDRSRSRGPLSRRYSDRVKGLPEEVDGEQGGSEAKNLSLFQRAKRFASSLLQFLVRTAVISLMVAAVFLLIQDGLIFSIFRGRHVSNTVFCPSNPNEPPPLPSTLPKGQLACMPCPEHALCTEGKMECFPTTTYVREGDRCVLNDEAHKGAINIKENAINFLRRRLGDVDCGYTPPESASLSEPELKRAIRAEMSQIVPTHLFDPWWSEALNMIKMESISPDDSSADLTGIRISKTPSPDGYLYRALEPEYGIVCQVSMLIQKYLIQIIVISLILSFATYLWYLLRRWRHRRQLTASECDLIRERLQQNYDQDYGTGQIEFRPLAVAHLREEFIQKHGARVDPLVWQGIVDTLVKDTRIEKGKTTFGHTERDSWTWTGPLPIRR